MPQVVGWGMRLGLHSDSDQGQEFEDRPSADLNTHLMDTKEELLLLERKRQSFQTPPFPLDNKTVAHWILGAELRASPLPSLKRVLS